MLRSQIEYISTTEKAIMHFVSIKWDKLAAEFNQAAVQ
jgi:hypothetical protein